MAKEVKKISNDESTTAKAVGEKELIVGILKDYNRYPGATLRVLNSVVAGMTDNVYFPDMTPKIEDLVTAQSNLIKALEDSRLMRGPMSSSKTEAAQKVAIPLLDTCADYVLEKSNNDYSIARTSGFTMKKTSRNTITPKPGQAIITDIVKSKNPNEILFKLKSLGYGVTYLLEQSVNTPDNWKLVDTFTNSKKIVATGIEPGDKYFFRITGRTTGGYGAPSAVAIWIGQYYS